MHTIYFMMYLFVIVVFLFFLVRGKEDPELKDLFTGLVATFIISV